MSAGTLSADRLPSDVVCSIAKALEHGDEVLLGDRDRPMEVLGFEEQRNADHTYSSFYPAYILWLRDEGTEYRLRWSHTGENYPKLHAEDQLRTYRTTSVRYSGVQHNTVADGRGEVIREISVVGVDDGELADWAFVRNTGGVGDATVDLDADRGDGWSAGAAQGGGPGGR